MLTSMAKTILIAYEPEHVPVLARRVRGANSVGSAVVAFDAEIEFELERIGISFISARDFRGSDQFERLVKAEEWAREVFNTPSWDFLTYRGVRLGALFPFQIQVYFQRLAYTADIIASVLEGHPDCTEIVMCASRTPWNASGAVDARLASIVVDCVRVIADARGIMLTLLSVPPANAARAARLRAGFIIRRALFGALVSLWNVAVRTRPRKRLRIVASEYWKNIEGLVDTLPESELVLLDRAEIAQIGLRAAWRHRMCFLHAEADRASCVPRARALAALQGQAAEALQREESFPIVRVRSYDFRALVRDVVRDILGRDLAGALEMIDGAFAILERERPHIVMLRATASRQLHFPILALVAEVLDIPSFELQHGLEYFGPGSLSRHTHLARYTGTYGPLVENEMNAVGASSTRMIPIGSPRFDTYARLPPAAHEGITVLCIVPPLIFIAQSDTYDVLEYFGAVASALRAQPGSSLILKLRGSALRSRFYQEAIESSFSGIAYTVMSDEPLASILPRADIVVSPYSTVVLESMIVGLPVVLVALRPHDKGVARFHYERYEDARALTIATSAEALKDALLRLSNEKGAREATASLAKKFLAQNFLFDGRATERLAAFIRSFENS